MSCEWKRLCSYLADAVYCICSFSSVANFLYLFFPHFDFVCTNIQYNCSWVGKWCPTPTKLYVKKSCHNEHTQQITKRVLLKTNKKRKLLMRLLWSLMVTLFTLARLVWFYITPIFSGLSVSFASHYFSLSPFCNLRQETHLLRRSHVSTE